MGKTLLIFFLPSANIMRMKSKRMMQSAGEGKMFIKEAKLEIKKCILPFKNQLFRKKPIKNLPSVLYLTPHHLMKRKKTLIVPPKFFFLKKKKKKKKKKS